MKTLMLPLLLVFLAAGCASEKTTSACCEKPIAGITEAEGTCNPNGTCDICKNCKYCKNCAKNGGSCSVCK